MQRKLGEETKFGAGEGIRIPDPLSVCLMGYQKLKKYIESTLQIKFRRKNVL